MKNLDNKMTTIDALLNKNELINATVISSASLFFLIYFLM